jgi:hypothetical protein
LEGIDHVTDHLGGRNGYPQHNRPAWFAACAVLWLASLTGVASAQSAGSQGGLEHARRGFASVRVRPDRLQHASLSFSVGLGAGLASRSAGTGFGVGLGLGVGKEVLDRNGTGFDAGDLLADAVGASLALLAVRALER